MKLIVGLGNPGEKYSRTRHNVGFLAVDGFASAQGGSGWSSRFDGLASDVLVGGEKTILLKPMTFMNRSGQSVRKAVDFYKLANEDVLVVCDDLNLPVGRLRLRGQGSAGGQKGLKDIIQHLGTDAVPRLRIGIGANVGLDAADYVLAEFGPGERSRIDEAVIESLRAMECWCRLGIQAAMTGFNGKDSNERS